MVDWRCNFIQSIDSHKSKKKQVGVEYARGALQGRSIRTKIDRVPEHEEQWLNSQVTSTLNTAPIELILDRGLKYLLKKGLAEFQGNPSTTEEVLPDGSSGSGTIVEFSQNRKQGSTLSPRGTIATRRYYWLKFR